MKILLIEDDTAVRDYVKEIVSRFSGVSFDLVSAGLLAAAIPYFSDDEIGVIILDLNLPDSQGLETFRAVHRQAGHIPIIILSGTDDDGLALEAVEAGAQDYLVKGEIGVHVLQKAVQYAIERHRNLRELEMANSWLRTEEEALADRQRQLRISESLYRTLFMTVGAPTAILDEEGKIILANAEIEALFGFATGEVEGTIHWSKFVPPDDLPGLAERWRLLHEDPAQAIQRYEARLVDRWGRIRHGIVSVKLIPHTKNCVISITDITERKRWEEVLRENEVRFRELYDRMSSGVAVYLAVRGGEDFILQDINRAAERIEGVTKKEVLGRRVTEVFPGVHDLGLLGVLRKVWETGTPEYHPRSLYRDDRGTGSWRENWVYRLPTGEIVAVYNDVTDRVHAETALRESEERQRLLLEYSGLGIAYWDYTGKLLFLNRKAAENMGGKAADFTGKRMEDLFPPELALTYLGRIAAMRGEGGRREYEDLVPLPGGDRWFLSTFTTVKNAFGEPLGVQIISQEITDRKRMEEALQQRENTLETLLNAPMDLMALLDTKGIILAMNRSGARMMGMEPKDLRGRNVRDFFPADIGEKRSSYLSRVLETGEPVEFEDQRDGMFFLNRMFPVFNPQHTRVEQVAVIASDITKRRRAEEALSESEEKFRTVVEHVPDLIVVHREGRILYVNPGTRSGEMMGYTPDEMLGRPILDYIAPEYHAMVTGMIARRLQDELVEPYEMDLLSRSGRRTFMVSGSRIDFDGKPAILNVLTDITDRKEAEQALRESEERYRAVVESQTEFITRFTPEFLVTFVNDAYCSYFGIRREEVVGKRFKPLIPEEDREAVRRHFASLTRENPVAVIEHRTVTPSGEVRWQKWVDRAIYDGKGILVEYQSVGRDTTDRRHAEEALRESEEKYRSLVERANDGIAILQEGRVVFVNANQAHFWGGTVEEIAGRPFADFVHPGERGKLLERYRQRLGGEKVVSVYETVLQRRDGTGFPAEVSAGVISYRGAPADLVIIRDITERKHADRALRESEARLKAVVEGSPIPQFVIGKDHRILYWNRALEDLSGIPASEVVGTAGQWKAFYGEERPVLADLVVDGATREISRWYESKVQPSKFIDGAYEAVDFFPNLREGGGWLYFTAAPVRDAGGSVIGAVETLEDITDRKRAEEALRQSEERYRTVIETANEAIVVAQDGILKFVNPRAVEMLETTPEDISSVPFAEFIHPDDRAMVVERNTRRIGGEDVPSNYDFRFVGRGGRVTWVHISAVRIIWNGRPATLNFLMDVTERREVEQALKDSEEMFRNPVEHSPVGVFLVQDGILKYANSRLAEMAGYTREEIVNTRFDTTIHPEDVPKVQEEIGRLLSGEVSSARVEYRGVGKAGSTGVVEAYGSSMLFHGRPAIYGTIIDVTERKRLENQIRESLREKEVLLREIHHRVKNNMQVISSLLSVQAQNIRDETIRGLFKESQNRIRSIALVHELLYRSDKLDQIEYGAYLKKMFVPLFESYSVDPRKVAMAIDARDTMITIEKAVPCSLIVNELISNSLKHAFPGDRKGEIRIIFVLDTEAGRYVLDYRDNGVGIPPALDVATCPTLGMRLIHGLTRQLQGTIEAGNQGGAHFHISFPAENARGGSL